MSNLRAPNADAPSSTTNCAEEQSVRIARLLCLAEDADTVREQLLRGTMQLYDAHRGVMVLRENRQCLYFASCPDNQTHCMRAAWPLTSSSSHDTPWHWTLGSPEAEWIELRIPEDDDPDWFLCLNLKSILDAQDAAARLYQVKQLMSLATSLLRSLSLRDVAQTLADERHAAEEALRDVDAFMADAQRISRTGSWTWDPSNPGAGEWSLETYAMLGYDPATTSASFEANVARIHPDDRARYLQVLEGTVAQGRDLDVEYRYLLPDGTVRHAHARGKRVSPTLYVGTANDISERRAAELAVRKAHAELAAASRLTTLGELSASLTHELNQPFTAAVANAAASKRWLNREVPDDHRARQSVESLLEDARRAQAIIASLRALARKSEPERRFVDLDEAIVEIAALSRSELDMHSVDLRLDLRAQRIPVLIDRVQLQQVALTSIMTCLESTRQAHEHPKTIWVSTSWAPTETLILAIEGCGAVMDPSLIAASANLLDPGTRGHLLELSVCRSIVEAHEGSFRVVDGKRAASRFEISLPRGTVAS